MRTQKVSPGKRPKAPAKKPARRSHDAKARDDSMRASLSTIEAGTWLVIRDQLGPRHAVFARVTRAGKGSDVFVDLPRGADFTRVLIPIADVITIARDGQVPAVASDAWRKLAADAVKQYRELASLTDDSLRDGAVSSAAQLERRLRVLAGQQEMFT